MYNCPQTSSGGSLSKDGIVWSGVSMGGGGILLGRHFSTKEEFPRRGVVTNQ